MILEHNPLKSNYNQKDHLNAFAVYDDLDNSNSEDSSGEENNHEVMDVGYSSGDEFIINPGKFLEGSKRGRGQGWEGALGGVIREVLVHQGLQRGSN